MGKNLLKTFSLVALGLFVLTGCGGNSDAEKEIEPTLTGQEILEIYNENIEKLFSLEYDITIFEKIEERSGSDNGQSIEGYNTTTKDYYSIWTAPNGDYSYTKHFTSNGTPCAYEQSCYDGEEDVKSYPNYNQFDTNYFDHYFIIGSEMDFEEFTAAVKNECFEDYLHNYYPNYPQTVLGEIKSDIKAYGNKHELIYTYILEGDTTILTFTVNDGNAINLKYECNLSDGNWYREQITVNFDFNQAEYDSIEVNVDSN